MIGDADSLWIRPKTQAVPPTALTVAGRRRLSDPMEASGADLWQSKAQSHSLLKTNIFIEFDKD
jgi:hypothetical protein